MTAPTAAEPPPLDLNDLVLLAALANGGHGDAPLAPQDEHLLAEAGAGALTADSAMRIVALVRRNARAAERILERRLVDAASRGPPAPRVPALADAATRDSRLVALSRPVPRQRVPPRPFRRRLPGGFLALAAATAVVVASLAMLQSSWRDQAGLQVAVVTVADRTPLLEPGDSRRRGPTSPSPSPAAGRFQEVELPADLLRRVLAAGGSLVPEAVGQDLAAVVPALRSSGGERLRLYVDAALATRLADRPVGTMAVRFYDLADPRSAELREMLGAPAGSASWLLTGRP